MKTKYIFAVVITTVTLGLPFWISTNPSVDNPQLSNQSESMTIQHIDAGPVIVEEIEFHEAKVQHNLNAEPQYQPRDSLLHGDDLGWVTVAANSNESALGDSILASEAASADAAVHNNDAAIADGKITEAYFPDTPLGHALSSHMSVVEGLGPDAEMYYQASLQTLRQQPKASVDLLSAAYTNMDEAAYLERWKVVDTISAIETDYALDVLSQIAQAEIPNEQYPGDHSISSRAEEQMIRRAAIRGIEQLTKNGNPGAVGQLQGLVKVADQNVREGAVLALLRTSANREKKKQQLKTVLPQQDHWMLSLSEHASVSAAGNVDVPAANENDLPAAAANTESIDNVPPNGVLP